MNDINEIDLSAYSDRFNTTKLSHIQHKNFFFGKNGSGKSTITKAIYSQYHDQYDIHIFNGFENMLGENQDLDAFSLGRENAENQEKINQSATRLSNLNKSIAADSPTMKDFNGKEQAYSSLKKQIQTFFTLSARKVGLESNPSLVDSRRYNKRKFEADVSAAKPLDDDEIVRLKKIAQSKPLDIKPLTPFPTINFESLISETESVLSATVTPKALLQELVGNPEKQSFAQKGRELHKAGDICSFCGNVITKERLSELDTFFSDKVDRLKNDIDHAQESVNQILNSVRSIEPLNPNNFFPHLRNQVEHANAKLQSLINDNITALTFIHNRLDQKKNNEFKLFTLGSFSFPNNFQALEKQFTHLNEENNEFSKNLASEQQSALQKLRLNKVQQLLTEFNYAAVFDSTQVAKTSYTNAKRQIDLIKANIDREETNRLKLIASSTSESIAVKNINHSLKSLGNQSFSLVYVPNQEGQAGLYRVKGNNDAIRGVSQLSTGEKNLVTFLYFMNSLKSTTSNSEKEKIVVFDDPVNSNDDTIQYLVIGTIQYLYRSPECPQFFLLTHNNNFYNQVTPSARHYGRQGYFHLIKDNSKTIIKPITKSSDDLKSLYGELWDELIFAYDHNKPTFMWNIMRRILETYNRFIYANNSPADITKEILQNNPIDDAFLIGLVKSLNENSHLGDGSDMDITTSSPDSLSVDDLKAKFHQLFSLLGSGAEKHFNAHWPQ